MIAWIFESGVLLWQFGGRLLLTGGRLIVTQGGKVLRLLASSPLSKREMMRHLGINSAMSATLTTSELMSGEIASDEVAEAFLVNFAEMAALDLGFSGALKAAKHVKQFKGSRDKLNSFVALSLPKLSGVFSAGVKSSKAAASRMRSRLGVDVLMDAVRSEVHVASRYAVATVDAEGVFSLAIKPIVDKKIAKAILKSTTAKLVTGTAAGLTVITEAFSDDDVAHSLAEVVGAQLVALDEIIAAEANLEGDLADQHARDSAVYEGALTRRMSVNADPQFAVRRLMASESLGLIEATEAVLQLLSNPPPSQTSVMRVEAMEGEAKFQSQVADTGEEPANADSDNEVSESGSGAKGFSTDGSDRSSALDFSFRSGKHTPTSIFKTPEGGEDVVASGASIL